MVSTRAYQPRNAEDGALVRLHYLCERIIGGWAATQPMPGRDSSGLD
jgi:hypothetical protein